jgi:hypothetical protein
LHFECRLQGGGVGDGHGLFRDRHLPLPIGVVLECIAVENVLEKPLARHGAAAAKASPTTPSDHTERVHQVPETELKQSSLITQIT